MMLTVLLALKPMKGSRPRNAAENKTEQVGNRIEPVGIKPIVHRIEPIENRIEPIKNRVLRKISKKASRD